MIFVPLKKGESKMMYHYFDEVVIAEGTRFKKVCLHIKINLGLFKK